MIKLIASDMDGTLLNRKHEISKENLEAIKRAEALGVKFAIATGRIYDDVYPYLKAHNLKCQCIVMNGAEYRDEEGKVLKRIDIEKDKAITVLDMIKKYEILAQIYTRDGIYTNASKEIALIGMAHRLRVFEPGITMDEAIELAKKERHFLNLKYVKDLETFFNQGLNVGKVVIFNDNKALLNELKEKLMALGGLAISSSFSTNLEINHIQAQKGYILSQVIEDMSLGKDEVMVLGDSFNDYSLFELFPESFAMGNAIPEIKQIAKYITDTNDNAGVAKAIYKALKLEG